MRFSPRAIVVIVLASLALPAVAAAQGGYQTEPTREQWVEQADELCKPYGRAYKRLRKIGPLTSKGKYPAAGRVLIGVANVVLDVNAKVAALARPPADEDAIAAYVKGERRGAELAKAAGKVLRKAKVRRARRLIKRADRVQDRANENVRDFGLRNCI